MCAFNFAGEADYAIAEDSSTPNTAGRRLLQSEGTSHAVSQLHVSELIQESTGTEISHLQVEAILCIAMQFSWQCHVAQVPFLPAVWACPLLQLASAALHLAAHQLSEKQNTLSIVITVHHCGTDLIV